MKYTLCIYTYIMHSLDEIVQFMKSYSIFEMEIAFFYQVKYLKISSSGFSFQ